jgi:hypothetical protein
LIAVLPPASRANDAAFLPVTGSVTSATRAAASHRAGDAVA